MAGPLSVDALPSAGPAGADVLSDMAQPLRVGFCVVRLGLGSDAPPRDFPAPAAPPDDGLFCPPPDLMPVLCDPDALVTM
jgi:hypothetical protein